MSNPILCSCSGTWNDYPPPVNGAFDCLQHNLWLFGARNSGELLGLKKEIVNKLTVHTLTLWHLSELMSHIEHDLQHCNVHRHVEVHFHNVCNNIPDFELFRAVVFNLVYAYTRGYAKTS
jgi:fumarate reductase subunit D